MSSTNPDKAFEQLKQVADSIGWNLSETDSRSKIIDPLFKDVLGWAESDIRREEPVHKGFMDYIFRLNDRPIFVLEAKRNKSTFTIPLALKRRRYKINGSISSDNKIMAAIEQVQEYCIESGAKFAIVSNGNQFIIFQAFVDCGRWRDGYCVCFRSLDDIRDNFSLFWNILSKNQVIGGSLRKYVAKQLPPIEFFRPLDFVHNENASSGKNFLSVHLNPIINYIFRDLTEDSKLEILRKCYVRQRHLNNTDSIIRSTFDRMPHYSKVFDINWFKESTEGAGEFQVSFEKCFEFSRTQTPMGSFIILLGGIGSGKTTFIHHFFKIGMEKRDDVLWFYVDFKISHPDLVTIEDFIYERIVEHYEKNYKTKLGDYLKSVGITSIAPKSDELLVFFTMLRFKGYNISIVLDNVDQHSYTSPLYQERVFELAQNLTDKFKTVSILTLREESFFRSTRSGVLDAYHIPMFHIASPDFEQLIRNRVDYALQFLKKDEEDIIKIVKSPFSDLETVKQFFMVIKYSIRQSRRIGRDILKLINDVSGGDMRQALRFINTFMTSGNTDIKEMIQIEQNVPPGSPAVQHYQIPLHHIIRSIVLEDYRYYTTSHSHIMNMFQVNPQYTNSHFMHLRVLNYLHKRINYFVSLDFGFVDIDQILEAAEFSGVNQKAVEESLKKLADHNLVEFNNQNKEGYDSATYVRITTTGKYYFEFLIKNFHYIELMSGDTLNCNEETSRAIKMRLNVNHIANKKERMEVRMERNRLFLDYLEKMEESEFNKKPELLNSDLTKTKFMGDIRAEYNIQEKTIKNKLGIE